MAETGPTLVPEPESRLPAVLGDLVEEGLFSVSRQPYGVLGTSLLVGLFRRLENDCQRAKVEIAQLQSKLDQQRDELETERRTVTRLIEREAAERESRPLRNFVNIVGSVLITAGIGIPTFADDASLAGYPLAMAIAGLVLVLFNTFLPTRYRTSPSSESEEREQ